MSQNILDEFLSEWDETEKQPDPIEFGFNSLRDMLDQCSDIMDTLGASVNRNSEKLARAQTRIVELETDYRKQYNTLTASVQYAKHLEQSIDKLKAQLAEVTTGAQLDHHTESIVCPNCNKIEQATVLHTAPFYSYVHNCTQCCHIIMESEWQTIEQMIQECTKE